MASVDIQIAQRTYPVSCRDGEEAHLRGLAALVDAKAADAADALGALSETRHLLFAALLLADELKETRANASGVGGGASGAAAPDPGLGAALESLAERVEALADRLGSSA